MLGILTKMLDDKYIADGYYLVEDEDFVYLYKDGERVAVFNATRTDIPDIEAYIEETNRLLEALS